MLSIISALVVVSTAFVGVSIYAQTEDSELTTFEEEAIAGGAEMGEAGLEDDTVTSTASDNATEDIATDDGGTEIADVSSLFADLQVCNVGTAEISDETEIAAVPEEGVTPTVSVEVMTETEVAELASNENEVASAGNATSAGCVLVGGDNETSTSAAGLENETSAAGNMTDDNATSTLGGSNETAIASAPESDEEILVIEGQDFAPGQVILIFTENALIGIDDVDDNGEIEAKVPVPDSGETAIAGNETGTTELRFVESDTQRTATFEFDGETLTASAGGDIEAAEGDATTAPTDNATSTNDTSTANTTSNYTVQ
ncbi:MAG TPA: hypothetical protein VD736_00320 [Nitrososphaera sp.]|nr:hypothetical protein [Nitrososphaera sp.]